MKHEIIYQNEPELDYKEFKSVLVNSTLGERRPVADNERLKKMCHYANIIITARIKGKLIGVARSLTDYAFCTYLSDLAVNVNYQHMGIGKKLVEKTFEETGYANLILLAAPNAITYYPKIGLEKFEYTFLKKRM